MPSEDTLHTAERLNALIYTQHLQEQCTRLQLLTVCDEEEGSTVWDSAGTLESMRPGSPSESISLLCPAQPPQ